MAAGVPARNAPVTPDAPGEPRSRRTLALAVVLSVVVIALVAFVLYARGGGPVPRAFSFLSPGPGSLLAASGPEETVLRTVRLVGVERAAVGEERGTAIVRMDVPTVSSAGDVEIAWQAGMAALVQGYPRADEYVVQIFVTGTPYAEVVAGEGDAARTAVGAEDAAALWDLVTVTLLPEEASADE